MTAATQARPKPTSRYQSGHCGIGRHEQCRGVYAGTDCGCPCHRCCVTCGQPLRMETP